MRTNERMVTGILNQRTTMLKKISVGKNTTIITSFDALVQRKLTPGFHTNHYLKFVDQVVRTGLRSVWPV